jgi:hypothetical protein
MASLVLASLRPVVKVRTNQSLPTYDVHAGEWHTTVAASNHGRAAATVKAWTLKFPDGRSLLIRSTSWSDDLPLRLDAQASGSWHVPTSQIEQACKEHR